MTHAPHRVTVRIEAGIGRRARSLALRTGALGLVLLAVGVGAVALLRSRMASMDASYLDALSLVAREHSVILISAGAFLGVAVLWLIFRSSRRGSSGDSVSIAAPQAAEADGVAAHFEKLFAAAPDGMLVLDQRGEIRMANQAAAALLGRPASELTGTSLLDAVTQTCRADARRFVRQARQPKGAPEPAVEVRFAHDERLACMLEIFRNRRKDDPVLGGVLVRMRRAGEHAQTRLAVPEETPGLAHTLIEAAPLAIIIEDTKGLVRTWNAAAEQLFGWKGEELLGNRNPTPLETGQEEYLHLRERVLLGTAFTALETQRRTKDGTILDVAVSTAPLRDGHGDTAGVMEVVANITQHKQLEAQLRQAQRMESIGRLAGGIAHDFNNLLTAILGYAQLMQSQLNEERDRSGDAPAADPGALCHLVSDGLDEIVKAGERATTLTQGLLAFSRNQVMQPTILDLNSIVREMQNLLGRMIGERVELQCFFADDLKPVKVDRTQIEQVVLNLVVNAGDAMPDGGKLTIETASVELDELYARKRVAVVPGAYVMLAVSDNGCGMDKETQAHVFEPFFTTKPRGKGTGLGLATAYGIVKQSGGYIWVYSEVGLGTTFKVYLPESKVGSGRIAPERAEPTPAPKGSETILLVEDEETVRALIRQVLGWHGYRVIEARNGEEALQASERHSGPIHLMLTDVVMPGMSAADLVGIMVERRPALKVIFMSGYTDHAIARHGLLDPALPFLQKPFAPDRLAHKIRDVLNQPSDRAWTAMLDLVADREKR